MIELIREMIRAPEAQADAHYWASVLLGHWAIGAGLTGLVMAIWSRSAWDSALMLSLAYLLGWEGGQMIMAAYDLHVALSWQLVWDAVLDWTAVSLGALTTAAVWQRRRRIIAGSVAAVAVVLAVGVGRRR